MQTQDLFLLNEFCIKNNIEISFINSLHTSGLIEITTIEEQDFINTEQLKQLEKIKYYYYELEINLEGIETIMHLLAKIKNMQDEIIELKNKLNLYENL